MAFGVCQMGPAFAYGPHEEFGGRHGINAMVYFRLPLNASGAVADRPASFGFAVKSEFLFAHPAYQREKGPYLDSTRMYFGLMDLRFGMNGKLSGLDVAGFTALGAKAGLK